MTKSAKAKKRKVFEASKRSATKAPWVWRIFHFGERFELSENIRKYRKSALEFSRDFVGDAGGDEAVGYNRQFALLSNGDGLNFGLLYGVYRLLINLAAKQSRAFRGYLLDARNRPLTDAQIGKLLKIETKQMRKFLRQFASVDLLERVELPEFDMSINEPPPRNGDGNDRGGSKKKSAAGTRKSRSGGRGRDRTEISVRVRKPLKGNGKRVNKKHGNYVIDNDKNQRKTNNDKRRGDDSNALKGQIKGRTTTTPTTAPSFMPKASDAGGTVIDFTSPPGSAKQNRVGPQKLGDVVAGMEHRYHSDAKGFGSEIYRALKLPFSPVSTQGRRELGSFASMWMKAKKKSLSHTVLDELWRRAIQEACKIAPRRRKGDNVSAIWCKVFNDLLAKRCSQSKSRCKTIG